MTDKAKLLKVAQKHLSKGNLDKAIKTFQNLVEVDPRDQRLTLRLADLQARAGRKSEAVQNYEKVATRYIQQDFTPKAIAVYKTILRLDPELLSTYDKLAELYKSQGLEAEALSQLENLFQIYEKRSDEGKQIEVLQLMVNMDPENLGFQVRLGETLARKGRKQEAAEAFAKAATTLSRRGFHDRASQLFEKITGLNPDNTAVRKELCAHYLESGQFKEARKEIEAILAVEPDDPRMALLLGRIHFQLGNNSGGEQMIAQSLQLFLKSGELEGVMREYLFVAQSHLRNGELDESEAFYRQIMMVVPGEIRAIKGLICVAEARNDRVGQIKNLLLLGRSLVQSRDAKGACKAFEKVSQLDPLNEEAKGYLARVQAGDLEALSAAVDSAGPGEAPVELGAAELEELTEIEDLELISEEGTDVEEGMEISEEEEIEAIDLDDGQELEFDDIESVEVISEEEIDSIPDIVLEDFDDEVELVAEGGGDLAPGEPGVSAFEPEASPEEEMTVDELLAEAEVYERYGLTDKVMEILESARAKAPDDPRVLERIEAAASGAPAPADAATGQVPGLEESVKLPDETLAQPPEAQPVSEPGAREGHDPFAEDMEEADFYMSQGLEDEAHRIYQSILKRSPGHAAAAAAIEGVEAPSQGSAPPVTGAPPVPESPAAPAQKVPAAGTRVLPGDAREVKGRLIVEDSETEGAGGFLDLAEELRTELADEFQAPAETVSDGGGITFEEIFSQFKKGIAETLGDEEYETHYNLGIAYKDMGLSDDALREFEISSRDPDLAQDSLSLMAMCFVEKKDLDSAVKAIQKAIDISEVSTRTGLFYQMGETLERKKAWPEAVAAYEEVQAKDPTFERIGEAIERVKSHLVEEAEDEVEADMPLDGGMDDMLSDLIREVEEMARETAGETGDDPGKPKKDRISYL
ncbi:MAG: tetratricopeptide repeat protein [bacterium]|nr:tetratricopeptide repeat protein [bacterium]